jgi:hypothetical protein
MAYCRTCGSTGPETKTKRGNNAIENTGWIAAVAAFVVAMWAQIEPGTHGYPSLVGSSNQAEIRLFGIACVAAIAASIAYGIYRRAALPDRCTTCGATTLIPENSPAALTAAIVHHQ